MKGTKYWLLGLLGPLVAIFFVVISIIYSPWFSFFENALSDLGHSGNSNVASLFNFGLLLSGLLIILYCVEILQNQAKYSSYFLVISGFFLQLIATFDEIYRSLHFQVSVLFFVTLGFSSMFYAIEKKSVIALISLIVGLVSWIVYGAGIFSMGIAIPEAISSIAAFVWIILSSLKVQIIK